MSCAVKNLIIEELIKSEKIDADCLRRNDNEEVLEWWLVTPWLAERLKEQGEIIIDELGCCWWGRTSSGQGLHRRRNAKNRRGRIKIRLIRWIYPT